MPRTYPESTEKERILRWLPATRSITALLFSLFLVLSCSPGDPVQADLPGSENADATPSDTAEDPATSDDEGSGNAEAATDPTPQPSVPPEPEPVLTVGEDDVVEIVDLGAGEQHIDAQGNLIIVYGLSTWPEAFDALPVAARSEFAFSPEFGALSDPQLELVAIDIGMCGAGIGSGDSTAGFGTAEFFVHDSATAPLSNDPALNRAVVTNPPLAGAGFEFPAEASCARGWLPVLRSSDGSPTTARYVLTNRTSSSASIERHIYQWQIDSVASDLGRGGLGVGDAESDAAENEAAFGMGQTVTFNEGPIADTTVVVDGWAELTGQDSSIEGIRPVGVLLSFCPSSLELLDFGLAVDGWNLVAPDPGAGLLGALATGDPTLDCFDGWLEFAVPFGSVPTGFFASDGAAVETGYAFWSLDGAALAPPPEE